MKKTEAFYEGILDNLYDGIYFVDRDRRITYWNKAAERITGFRRSEVLGSFCHDHLLSHINDEGERLCGSQCPLANCIETGRPTKSEAYLHHREGYRLPVSIRVTPILNESGEVIGAAELFSDNSAKAHMLQRIEELETMALIDPLTRMANRRYLEMHLSNRIEEMHRYGWGFGVLFADIDDFKRINDTYGHDAGDKVLKMVARTLAGNARPFDIFGRWGGEEFVAVIENVSIKDLPVIANRFRLLVDNSYLSIADEKIRVSVSVGATVARREDTVDTVVRRADRLMYQSKRAGKNRLTTDASRKSAGLRPAQQTREGMNSDGKPVRRSSGRKGKTAEL
jgi:diguanylate cyclase (GGDEF)-like protein/PAS domain S-box-containing protein